MKSMKWLVWVLIVGLAAPVAMGAALLNQGSNEIAVSGLLDFDSEVGTDLRMDLKYAYFFWDRISAGVRTGFENTDDGYGFSFGVLGEYNFAMPASYKPLFGTDLVPFVGIMTDYEHSSLEYQETGVSFGAEGGVKFFLTDTTAITLSMVGKYATADVFRDNDAEDNDFRTNKDLSFLLGLRFYF